jgi:exosortase
VAGLLVVTLYGQILADMAADWWNLPSLSQGLLIPPLALTVAWLLRDEIRRAPAIPSSTGYWVMGTACLLLFLGRLAAEYFVQRVSFVVLLVGFVLTFWGRYRLRCLAFPFLLLATMVPLPVVVYNSFAVPLQLLASNLAADIARLCGVAVYQDGNIIHLAGISLGVEEACSGLSSISALLMASLLLGFMVRPPLIARGILFALAVPVAMGVNIIRVAGSAILADYDQRFARGFYHSFSGWLVFVLGAAALLGTTKVLAWWFDQPKAK